jgi:hypothetical protein
MGFMLNRIRIRVAGALRRLAAKIEPPPSVVFLVNGKPRREARGRILWADSGLRYDDDGTRIGR